MNNIELKNRIKEIRNEKGLSQNELAYMVGTSRQTIIVIEKNTFCPTARLAYLLCLTLDKKFEELFYVE